MYYQAEARAEAFEEINKMLLFDLPYFRFFYLANRCLCHFRFEGIELSYQRH